MWFNPFDVEFSKEYSELKNKPKINNIELSGNKSWSDLGLANPMHIAGTVNTVQDLPVTANEGDVYIVGLQNEEKVEYVYITNGWEYLGTMTIEIDDAMSTTSENPVQNKVVNAAKQDKIDTNNKLDADLVNDLSSTNKFTTASEKQTWNSKQDAIDSTHKLDADLIDDTNTTNKFTNATEKQTWNGKQDAIDSTHKLASDLVDDSNSTNNKFCYIDSNGNLFIGGIQVTQIIDSDSYAALATKENRFYLIYPTPSNGGA